MLHHTTASQNCFTFLQLSSCPTLASPAIQPPTCAVTVFIPSPPQEISAVTNTAPAVCTVGSPCALENCRVISTPAPPRNEKNLKIFKTTEKLQYQSWHGEYSYKQVSDKHAPSKYIPILKFFFY